MIPYDNLRNIFQSGKKPFWFLYLGKAKSSGTPIGSNTEESDIDAAWTLLEDLLDNYGDGVYTIEVRSSINAAKNNPMHVFYVGEQPRGAAVGNPIQTVGDTFTKGVDMRYWMDRTDALNEKLSSVLLDNLALKNQLALEKMKRKEADTPDTLGRILGVVERRPDILSHITGLLAGGQAPAAIGVLKKTEDIPNTGLSDMILNGPTDEGYDDDEYEDDDEPSTFSIDRAVSACYRLSVALPGQDINKLLEKIAHVAETDKSKIEMALKFL